eukprot:TRINITY_DN3934_c0_g1_i1.p1 TRINITY_DN3934_c0_g1~~TRINITY_DN3934_c0_g1_i1.p1  ORF type:complete len:180 (-),score=0.47 TRINITY_DN3934_c0_g1_i1:416-916(-)
MEHIDQLKTLFMNKVSPPENEEENLSGLFSGLSYTKRITGFAICLSLGLLSCFVSSFFLITPRIFAKFYTLGCILLLASATFLVGPTQQIRTMFAPQRFFSAVIYIAAILGTLYCALWIRRTGLSLVMIFVQFGAALWYGASYIPFAQSVLKEVGNRGAQQICWSV